MATILEAGLLLTYPWQLFLHGLSPCPVGFPLLSHWSNMELGTSVQRTMTVSTERASFWLEREQDSMMPLLENKPTLSPPMEMAYI